MKISKSYFSLSKSNNTWYYSVPQIDSEWAVPYKLHLAILFGAPAADEVDHAVGLVIPAGVRGTIRLATAGVLQTFGHLRY